MKEDGLDFDEDGDGNNDIDEDEEAEEEDKESEQEAEEDDRMGVNKVAANQYSGGVADMKRVVTCFGLKSVEKRKNSSSDINCVKSSW